MRGGTLAHGKSYEIKAVKVAHAGGDWTPLYSSAIVGGKHAAIKVDRVKMGPLKGLEVKELHAGTHSRDWSRNSRRMPWQPDASFQLGTSKTTGSPSRHLNDGEPHSLTVSRAKITPRRRS